MTHPDPLQAPGARRGLLARLLADLPIGRKLLLLGGIAALVVAAPVVQSTRMTLETAAIAQREAAGVPPAGALLNVIQLAQQHRGLSAQVLAGNGAQKDARAAKQVEVDRALAALRPMLQPLQDAEAEQLLRSVDVRWQALRDAVTGGAIAGPQSFAGHTQLIGELMQALESVHASSGMTLDPEAGTYYLMQAVLAHLPRLTEALGQARGLGAGLLQRGNIAPEERTRFAALIDTARLHQRLAQDSVRRAMAADARIRAAAAAAQQEADAAAQAVFALIEREIVKAEQPTLTGAEYFKATTTHIDAQFRLVDASFGQIALLLQERAAGAQRELLLVAVLVAVLGGAGLWLGLAVARAITRSLNEAVRVARAVADGDLTVAIAPGGRDEAGQLLQALVTMQRQLMHVVGTVRGNAESLATASAQIAQGNADLSQRTEEQASALQETAATMEQLSSTVRNNASHARTADDLARAASDVARKGGGAVGDMVETMKQINDSSHRIADIIGTIDGIAFRTNILALNAAVEAARAGEQGRGFAVVASEVRALAGRSAEAAREIKSLIGVSVERAERGSEQADRAGRTMGEVVAAIQRVSQVAAEISNASGEQAGGVTQVGDAIGQMDRVTQQNAALVEESAAAAESLRNQAAQLVAAVAVFRTGDEALA